MDMKALGRKRRQWLLLGPAAVLLIALAFAFAMGERRMLLPGHTSDGHRMFEEKCSACHKPFGAIANQQCVGCHQKELSTNTHPPEVFDDPRWASSLEVLDARRCVACHREHQGAPSVTIAGDFCFACHDDVVTKRETHKGFAPDSCGRAGCHNYHDNSVLNISFLARRMGKSVLLQPAQVLARTIAPRDQPVASGAPPDAPKQIVHSWEGSAHAVAGVDCLGCHRAGDGAYLARPAEAACARCHAFERDTFHRGKHGVRTGLGLTPLDPGRARLPMKAGNDKRALTCGTCHDAHGVDTRRAAVEACLSCHDDEHSRNFLTSPHGRTFQNDAGPRPGAQAVTCATCHMPRTRLEDGRVAVQHSNTLTLRPRDRMLPVCLSCHRLELAMSSLFDDAQVAKNFQSQPAGEPRALGMLRQFIKSNQIEGATR
jgi:hypothetical protein